ncbi:rhodanese-like domain-containing protein [Fictibacillus sp. KIGAM418]|uniref:Rhodanese-like domain-containing protein n=1 Tax=Fictibacillus marinisediminis TaxID=2878389 RepID=A0A9X1XFJ6_9BACL|nr:rhodanese-like domain-containing protein [Fictibacillus marinisediminis]MCK6258120.1 rhodanese-like domain-containing protein [Fictibacillus marinisediminis]
MEDQIKTITPEEVKSKLKKGETISLIDVREDEEVAEGKISEAKHIKMMEVPNRLDEINKDEEHILICRSGKRSENVAHFLQENGYKVKNMVGGMMAYGKDSE